jgi:hypothetical protein
MNIPGQPGETLNRRAKGELTRREAAIEAVLAHSGASADVQSLLCATIDIKKYCRSSCACFLRCRIAPGTCTTPWRDGEATHGVLFNPVGVILFINGAPSGADQTSHRMEQ